MGARRGILEEPAPTVHLNMGRKLSKEERGRTARTSRHHTRSCLSRLIGSATILLLRVERGRLCFKAPSRGSFGLLEQRQLGRRGWVINRPLNE